MRERPILFSAEMVRAILAGKKTQTRRVLKHAPAGAEWFQTWHHPDEDRRGPHFYAGANGALTSFAVPCPYGQPCDRLWVRETWYCDDYRVQRGPYLKPDDMDLDEARDDGTLIYRASSGDRPYEAEQPVWWPAIHMPRWASRILLEVTGVRVERLQSISRGDAMEEGCPFPNMAQGDDPRQWYADLWEQINGAGSSAANPWVWVVGFKRVEAT